MRKTYGSRCGMKTDIKEIDMTRHEQVAQCAKEAMKKIKETLTEIVFLFTGIAAGVLLIAVHGILRANRFLGIGFVEEACWKAHCLIDVLLNAGTSAAG